MGTPDGRRYEAVSLLGLLKERAFTIIPNSVLASLQLGQGVVFGRLSVGGTVPLGTGM
jgi:hypothetical protein